MYKAYPYSNMDLKPESIRTPAVGLDTGFLNDRQHVMTDERFVMTDGTDT